MLIEVSDGYWINPDNICKLLKGDDGFIAITWINDVISFLEPEMCDILIKHLKNDAGGKKENGKNE